MDDLVVAGGGARLIFPFIKTVYPTAMLATDSRFAVAEGMRRFGCAVRRIRPYRLLRLHLSDVRETPGDKPIMTANSKYQTHTGRIVKGHSDVVLEYSIAPQPPQLNVDIDHGPEADEGAISGIMDQFR